MMKKETCACRIQSTDGIAYTLLQRGQCGFLMVKEDDEKEYIIALEPERQGEDIYHWKQARYFKLIEDAEKAFTSLEKHFLKEGRAVLKCQEFQSCGRWRKSWPVEVPQEKSINNMEEKCC